MRTCGFERWQSVCVGRLNNRLGVRERIRMTWDGRERERERERSGRESTCRLWNTTKSRAGERSKNGQPQQQPKFIGPFVPSLSLPPSSPEKMCPNERHVWGLSGDGGSSGGGGMRRRDMKMVKPLYITLPSYMANIRKKGMCLRLFHRQAEAGT